MLHLWRAVAARPRLFIGFACGLAVAPFMPATFSHTTRAIVAWDIGVIVYLALSALLFTTERAERMEAAAEAQEEGEWTIFALTLAAVAFSFAAIFGEFAGAKGATGLQKNLHLALVAVTLFVSWLMTHTTFAFRYAHEYYAKDQGGPDIDRGLEFPEEPRPDYLDFMYFSLVLGMTFQVSDVQITARKLRRLAAVHGLLSFLFNTIILALTVNLAAGLL
jgi:uncharacterized membrane protein